MMPLEKITIMQVPSDNHDKSSLLLSFRYMLNYIKTCSLQNAHFADTISEVVENISMMKNSLNLLKNTICRYTLELSL